MAVVRVSDVIVPEIFNPYVAVNSVQRSALIASGALVSNPELDAKLAGGGLTFHVPAFNDLANDQENVGDDDPANKSVPKNLGTLQEIAVRKNRNQSWSSMRLAGMLAGADPAARIADRVSSYWTKRLQAAFISTVKGVFADNSAAPVGAEHVLNDMTRDISGGAYSAGVTDFGASAFIDACLTMGDAMGDLSLVAVHSIVYARMQKNNLIQFIPDSDGKTQIATFLGRRIVMDDEVPFAGSVFETWLFGANAVQLGTNAPDTPSEVKADPDAGNGSGQETLYSRVQWSLHPTGHQFIGATPVGGPNNAALASAASWKRVYPERKQIKMARLITREA